MVPMNVESIIAQCSRSITNSRYPRLTISCANSFRLPLFRKLPLPSTRTQTAGPFTPTRIDDCTTEYLRIQDRHRHCQIADASQPQGFAPLLPHVGVRFGHNPPLFDQQTTPRRHPAIVEVIVSHHFELRFVAAARIRIGNFLGLDMRMQFLLPILQPNRQIRRTARAPEKIEVIPKPFALVEPRHRAKKPVLSFEAN